MTIQQFREALEEEPFNPFRVHLADGRSIPVKRREFAAQSPSGRSIIVYHGEDHFDVVDPLLGTTLEVGHGKSNGRGRRRHG